MVKVIERFVVKAPHDGQPSVFGGTVLETLSNGQVIESQLAIVPVEELSEWIPSLNAQLLVENQSLTAERDSLTEQLAAMTTERDTALAEKASLQTQLDSANATIETLTSDKATLESTNAELQTLVSTLTAESDSAGSQLEAANERISTLETRITELTAEPEVPIVSRRQARLALLEMGFFEAVESAVYDGPKAGQIEYEADTWRRDNPTLIAMAKALGMSDEQIDQFFALASSK